jgi:hypothetical protein
LNLGWSRKSSGDFQQEVHSIIQRFNYVSEEEADSFSGKLDSNGNGVINLIRLIRIWGYFA